jgi:hypothetical protein
MNHATLYIGIEKDSAGKPIDPEKRAQGLAFMRLAAARRFGGYTLTNCVGGWTNPANEVIEEGAVRLDLYTDVSVVNIKAFARDVMRELDQVGIVLEMQVSNAEYLEKA